MHQGRLGADFTQLLGGLGRQYHYTQNSNSTSAPDFVSFRLVMPKEVRDCRKRCPKSSHKLSAAKCLKHRLMILTSDVLCGRANHPPNFKLPYLSRFFEPRVWASQVDGVAHGLSFSAKYEPRLRVLKRDSNGNIKRVLRFFALKWCINAPLEQFQAKASRLTSESLSFCFVLSLGCLKPNIQRKICT